jgi:putative effector of murein hydrolase
MVAVGRGTQSQRSGWAAMRPVLVAFLLVADVFVVAALAVSRRHGWLPPLIAFGVVLVGLLWFEAWAWRHRRDDG